MSYFDISGAVFNNQLRELETSDPAHADVFNAVFRQLINNDVALMEAASMFAGEKNKQAEFILNLKRTGKKGRDKRYTGIASGCSHCSGWL